MSNWTLGANVKKFTWYIRSLNSSFQNFKIVSNPLLKWTWAKIVGLEKLNNFGIQTFFIWPCEGWEKN